MVVLQAFHQTTTVVQHHLVVQADQEVQAVLEAQAVREVQAVRPAPETEMETFNHKLKQTKTTTTY